MQRYDVTARSATPPGAVWTLLLDAATWPTWSVVDALEAERSEHLAADGRDGVGAVRAFRTGRSRNRERITALEAERKFSYEVFDSPFFDVYHASIELEPTPHGGTRVRWHGTYRTRWGMGWLMQPYLRRVMQKNVDGLTEHADHQDGRSAGPPGR